MNDTGLPPGQRRIDYFPRFGTHLHRPPPEVPANHRIAIRGAVDQSYDLPLAEFADLPRTRLTSDFHCVAGWTATGLRWEGVAFPAFFETVIKPRLASDADITHITFGGLDGYHATVCFEDAMTDDVLLADRLDDQPLTADHGAPLRLVSPSQYGFISTKHLTRIELHTRAPVFGFGSASTVARIGFHLPLFRRHPRSRVWHEERHRYLPGPVVRITYRPSIPVIRSITKRR